jgi:hypothetical protein
MDVYNPDFHRRNLGKRNELRGSRTITETQEFQGRRLIVDLDYGDGARDHFDWFLYSLEEWKELAVRCGLALNLACSKFDETSTPSPEEARMQLVFSRR